MQRFNREHKLVHSNKNNKITKSSKTEKLSACVMHTRSSLLNCTVLNIILAMFNFIIPLKVNHCHSMDKPTVHMHFTFLLSFLIFTSNETEQTLKVLPVNIKLPNNAIQQPRYWPVPFQTKIK